MPPDSDSGERGRGAHECDRFPQERLHDAETTSRILGGVVSAGWLKDHTGEIPCTRLGRFTGWTDNDITRLLAENAYDSAGRKVARRRPN
jgi:hypothetical protein